MLRCPPRGGCDSCSVAGTAAIAHVAAEMGREPRKIIARRPGHMVHIDVKKVGRIPDGGGWRVHGRGSDQAKTVERRKNKGARGGYVYLQSAVDGFSRLAYTEALRDENRPSLPRR